MKMVRCPPCSKMQNTTGAAFPLEVSGKDVKNQSAVICDQIQRGLFVSPYDVGQGWVGVNCKDQGKHCKVIKVFFPKAENTLINVISQRRKTVQKIVF